MEELFTRLIRYPSQVAYRYLDTSITYLQLTKRIDEIAPYIKQATNHPVILYGHKEIDMLIGMLACIKAKRTYIPIDLGLPIKRIKRIIELTKSDLILTNHPLDLDIQQSTLSELKNTKRHVEQIDHTIAYMIFTSGSTGEPKGVPISYHNLKNFITWISSLDPLKDYQNIEVLNQANFNFDLSVADLYYALYNGHTLIALDKQEQNDFNPMFSRMTNATVSITTPTFMKLCLLNPNFNTINYPQLQCMYFCGEKLEKSLVRKLFKAFPALKIINAYGPTEATSAVSAITLTKDNYKQYDILPVGTMDTNATEICIQEDEIILKGDSVFSGYLGNIQGGYYNDNGINTYHTGDLGYIQDGLLFCKGRKDQQIKFNGYRIELGDIESNLLKIKGVQDGCVVVRYNKEGAVKMIKAFASGIELDPDCIKEQLKQTLPHYMIPKVITILDELPVNNNGKIDRKKLSEL